MAANQTIDFKDKLRIKVWLDAALEMEKEKYKKCPVKANRLSVHITAQRWGYVVAGYFLIEESFKALLHFRGKKKVPRTHSLSTLFDRLDEDDKAILREYYDDYKGTIGEKQAECLDDFLVNLDGDENERGDHVGSFDWRYFLIEEKRSREMPLVSVDYLHEIVYGCTRIIEYAHKGEFEPSQYTRTWRMRRERKGKRKYSAWLTVRRNSPGWYDLGDRLEILWGPDYRGRYDLYLSRGKERKYLFSEIPDDSALPVVDKRKEIETFDVEQGFRSIGVTFTSRPSTN